jgi:hypothetical protein
MMSALCLSIGEVDDMAKNTADRCADGVQDSERLFRRARHDQNLPSPRRALWPMAPATVATGSSRIAGDEETMARAARMGQP